MAKYGEGTNYAKAIDPSSTNLLAHGVFGGKVRVMQDTATISASSNLNSSDYIVVGGKLPIGAQVIQIILGSKNTAYSTSAYVLVGDEGDADRYMTTAGAVIAGGLTQPLTVMSANTTHIGPNTAAGLYYTVTGTTDNYIRISGYGDYCMVSSGDLNISIMYTVE